MVNRRARVRYKVFLPLGIDLCAYLVVVDCAALFSLSGVFHITRREVESEVSVSKDTTFAAYPSFCFVRTQAERALPVILVPRQRCFHHNQPPRCTRRRAQANQKNAYEKFPIASLSLSLFPQIKKRNGTIRYQEGGRRYQNHHWNVNILKKRKSRQKSEIT